MNAHSVNIYILDIKQMNISQPPSPMLLHFTLPDILTEMSCLVWILCRAARYTQHAKWLGHFLVVNTVNCQTSKRSGKGPQMMNPAYQVININVSSCHCLNWSPTPTAYWKGLQRHRFCWNSQMACDGFLWHYLCGQLSKAQFIKPNSHYSTQQDLLICRRLPQDCNIADLSELLTMSEIKIKVCTLDIAPLHQTPPQKHSGTADSLQLPRGKLVTYSQACSNLLLL